MYSLSQNFLVLFSDLQCLGGYEETGGRLRNVPENGNDQIGMHHLISFFFLIILIIIMTFVEKNINRLEYKQYNKSPNLFLQKCKQQHLDKLKEVKPPWVLDGVSRSYHSMIAYHTKS